MEEELEVDAVMIESGEILCDDLDEAIARYQNMGYRLDMIFPADSPREALMSRSEPPAVAGGLTSESHRAETVRLKLSRTQLQPPATAGGSDWITGRAGMEYRDLIPGRMGGKVIASHIRLTTGGEVQDYVHYHKVDFQMIYCLKGRIRVVYEDQGEPFWLEPGDCVLQPPEIRHRVLECEAESEVIEVSMPAEHETFVEHNITLPTNALQPDRDFSGQWFVRHVAASADWEEDEVLELRTRDTGIWTATDSKVYVAVNRQSPYRDEPVFASENDNMISLLVELCDGEHLSVAIMK